MTCTFHAKALLTHRRAAASDPNLGMNDAAIIINAIDQARWDHFEQTGCDCWSKAIAETADAAA